MVRNIAAALAGLVVGMAANMSLIRLNANVLFPVPEGTNINDPAQLQSYVDGLPATAFLVVMVAHLSQAGIGGWVAARLAGSRPMGVAMIIGVIALIGGVMNMMSIKGPTWMYVELPLYLVVAWLVGAAETKRRAAA